MLARSTFPNLGQRGIQVDMTSACAVTKLGGSVKSQDWIFVFHMRTRYERVCVAGRAIRLIGREFEGYLFIVASVAACTCDAAAVAGKCRSCVGVVDRSPCRRGVAILAFMGRNKVTLTLPSGPSSIMTIRACPQR